MADSMMMAIVKSVLSTTVTSAMIAISMVRIGMIVYPNYPTVADVPAYDAVPSEPANKSEVVDQKTKRRIILGQNSIKDLGSSE